MKVPDLEDMIQRQVDRDFVCQECYKLLTEHHLYLDPICQQVFICCYLNDSMVHRFSPLLKEDGIDYSILRGTLNTMLPRRYQVSSSDISSTDRGTSYYYTIYE